MKHLGTHLALILAALAPQTLAAPAQVTIVTIDTEAAPNYCRLGLDYCGWNLINRDSSYKERIHRALCKRGICDPNDPAIWNSLWRCGEDIEFKAICGGAYSCQDGGRGRSDYCK
ncbi:hypothetical protein PRK78_004609 [Emydomyces testavorans]|uniref:Uncharacterized protein n=1 Tax=Emydomyces testavorans TaxID=2070801 RepID=A0AAF0IIR8_9EURO|nr:hypothetical protein PRK78_004609 [Emydomyces testavorans]